MVASLNFLEIKRQEGKITHQNLIFFVKKTGKPYNLIYYVGFRDRNEL